MPRLWLRKQPVYDNEILAIVNAAGGLGHHDETGLYGTAKFHGFSSYDEAHEHGKGLYRSALYMTRKGSLPGGYGLSASVKKLHNDDGSYSLACSVYDKEHGKSYVDTRYGPNPQDKPYSPHKYFGHSNYNT